MGVYDNLDSKYNMMGASSFSKLAPKRPNTVVFGAGPSKVQKINEEEAQQTASTIEKDKDTNGFYKCRKSLPVYRHRKTLINVVKKNDSLIVIGETGSGKTTQIPQFLFEAGLASSGCIGITQPRRVAAVSIASRVAQEQANELGKLVGYSVRFQDVTSSYTKIKYMTDGMMVREAMTDEILSDYSEFLGSLMTNLQSELRNSRWRIKYGEPKCNICLDLNETHIPGVFEVTDYESAVRIAKFKMVDLIWRIRNSRAITNQQIIYSQRHVLMTMS